MNTGNINKLILTDFLSEENENYEIIVELIETLNFNKNLLDYLRKEYEIRLSQPIEIKINRQNFSPKDMGNLFLQTTTDTFKYIAKMGDSEAFVVIENWLEKFQITSTENKFITLGFARRKFANK
jgi:hypothetical protein